MAKLSEVLDKITTDAGDEAFREIQVNRLFCLTPGIQIWNSLEELNIATTKPRAKLPFPGTVHPKCPCDICTLARAPKS